MSHSFQKCFLIRACTLMGIVGGFVLADSASGATARELKRRHPDRYVCGTIISQDHSAGVILGGTAGWLLGQVFASHFRGRREAGQAVAPEYSPMEALPADDLSA